MLLAWIAVSLVAEILLINASGQMIMSFVTRQHHQAQHFQAKLHNTSFDLDETADLRVKFSSLE